MLGSRRSRHRHGMARCADRPTRRSCGVRLWTTSSALPSYAQQGLDRPTLVHRAVRLCDLVERQCEVEHLAWIDLSVPYEIDQLRQVSPDRRRATVQMNVPIEEIGAREIDAVRNADVAHGATGTCAGNRLCHGFLRANAFEHRVGADA